MAADIASALAVGRDLLDRGEAEYLLAHVLGRTRAWLIAHGEAPIDSECDAQFQALLARRAAGEPLAYLIGKRGFWSLELEVSDATLIPRADTELLVELALQRLPTDRACAVADLGTGSGAVALALASERPLARVLGTDNSADALSVARHNAKRLHIGNVTFALGDWCAPLGGTRFDMIVSNPPYIESNDHHLDQGDLRFEPRTALVAGDDGLDAIRSIVGCAGKHLNAGGWLLFEHGWQQGAGASALLAAAGYVDVLTAPDLEGRDRVSAGRMR